jgi:hypothetical protein
MTAHNGEYVLAGYLRFVESETPGVIAEVVSTYDAHRAEPSSVPIYRRLNDEGLTVTKAGLEAALSGSTDGAS